MEEANEKYIWIQDEEYEYLPGKIKNLVLFNIINESIIFIGNLL